MSPLELLMQLLNAETLSSATQSLESFLAEGAHKITWRPVGRDNNAGTIEAAGDPGRSVVERVTNAIDAVIESEHASHNGRPECRSPRDAATAWLNVPTS